MEKLFKNHINKYFKRYIIGILGFGIFAILFIWIFPECYVQCYYSYLSGKLQLVAIKDMRSTMLSIGAGILAIVGIFLTWRRTLALDYQNNLNEANLIEERRSNINRETLDQYVKAVDQLKDDNIAVRLGGIYSLEKIMNSNDKEISSYHNTLIELFCAFVREKRQIVENKNKDKETGIKNTGISVSNNKVESDIQAIITVLGRRNKKENDVIIDLNNTNLDNINFSHLDFKSAILFLASLRRADLRKADLRGADLRIADLRGANLTGADLTEAYLTDADLILADLRGADLRGADLRRAKLSWVDFEDSCKIDFITKETEYKKDIINFIKEIEEARSLKDIKLDQNILEVIEEEFPELYNRIKGEEPK